MNPLQFNGYLWLAWFVYWMLAARNTKKTVESESILSRFMHLGPPSVAYIAIFTPLLDYSPLNRPFVGPVAQWPGVALTAIGLGYAIWARLHLGRNWSATVTLKENHQLIRSGPYALTRHPIYTGMILATIGSVLTAGKLLGILAFLVIIGSWVRKLLLEERFMGRQFGAQYVNYRSEVKALVPFVV